MLEPARASPGGGTSLSAIILAEILEEAGVPAGTYNLVTGPGSTVGNALVTDSRVDKIALTGSTASGQSIIRASADTLKHLTMELGGKSPNIVFADADLDKAALTAFYAIFWNKGEVCVAGSRLLVQRPVYGEMVERLTALAANARTGDPFDPATDFGPVASRAEYDKVLDYIGIGRNEARERLWVTLPAGHRLAARQEVDFAELADEPFIALPRSAGPPRDFWLATTACGGREPRIGAEAASPDEVFEAVVSRQGVALIAEGNVGLYERPDLVYRLVRGLPEAELAIA